MEAKGQVCPWCDTEIVWDPELGPEEECPHCLNPLRDYHSIVLPVRNGGQTADHSEEPTASRSGNGQPAEANEELAVFDELDDGFDELDAAIEALEEAVQQIVDGQDEAPECPSCRQFMLYVGDQQPSDAEKFSPVIPLSAGSALVRPNYSLKMFVCPSCYRVDYLLSEHDREHFLNILQSE
jgi:hypothetical protein